MAKIIIPILGLMGDFSILESGGNYNVQTT